MWGLLKQFQCLVLKLRSPAAGWDSKRGRKWRKGSGQAEPPRTQESRAWTCIYSPGSLQGPVPIPSTPTGMICIHTDLSFFQNLCLQLPTHHSHHSPHICSFTVGQARCWWTHVPPLHTAQSMACPLQDVGQGPEPRGRAGVDSDSTAICSIVTASCAATYS